MATKKQQVSDQIPEQENPIQAKPVEQNSPSIRRITQDENLMANVRDYAPPVLAVLGSLMTWASIQAPFIGTRNISGVTTDLGYIVILAAAAAMYFTYKPHATGRLAGSAIALLTTLGGYAYLQSIFSEMQAELAGNMFAETVTAGFGLGIHLTLIATVAMTYVAYRAYSVESHEK